MLKASPKSEVFIFCEKTGKYKFMYLPVHLFWLTLNTTLFESALYHDVTCCLVDIRIEGNHI